MRSIFFASWLCLATSAFHPPLLLLNVPKRPLVIRHASVRSHEKNDRFVRNPIHPSKHFRRQPRYDSNSKLKWIQQATDRFVTQNELGSLAEGKWHEVVSLVNAWSFFQKDEGQAPAQMEALLKVLVEERGAGNTAVELTIDLYNRLLDAWACAALFRTIEHPEKASQRAREILVMLQENYEHESCVSRRRNPAESCDVLKPNTESFNAVLHVVIRTEDILTARRLLAWMEYLHKSGKNVNAKPSRSAYIQILDAYAKTQSPQSGVLAEAFLRHMKHQDLNLPNTLCYNIAIKAWTSQRFRGREAAEHADRILEEMKGVDCEFFRPDIVSFGSVISAWASSGMKVHAVSRVEALLREIEDSDYLVVNTVVLNAVMSAWVKSKNPAAVERTEEILQQIDMSSYLKPDLTSYNTHLHALSMHSSPKRPDLAHRAEDLLEKMEVSNSEGMLPFGPNVFSYNLVIEGICRAQESTAAMRAARLLRQLIKRDDVEPDTFSFNQVLAAFSKSPAEGSATTAEDLLRYMDEAYNSAVHSFAKPDASSYAFVIAAYTRSGDRVAAERAERLLDEMKSRAANGEEHLKPTRICYNSLIDCWAKSGEGTFGARKAEALLQEMQEMFQAGDAGVSPNIMTFNAVLNAWARSGTRCCGYQAEKYLNQMWQLYNAGNAKVKPNDFSYNTVINAISKSKHEEKGQKALRILRRMDKLYQAGNTEARPNEITYTAVINSCAFPSLPDTRTRRKALDTALFTLKELQGSRYAQPNQVTYGTFIRACSNLLHDDDELRREIIKRVFQQCCKDGQVGQMVLNYTPKDLYGELLARVVQPNGKVSLHDLPPEWRRNAQDKDKWRPKQQYFPRKRLFKSEG